MKNILPLLVIAALAAIATPTRQAATAPKGLLNMSLRANVPDNQSIVTGFVLDQNGQVIIRAAGPALRAFGVPTAMENPVLQIWKDGRMIDTNDDWENGGAQAAARVGAFPFASGSKDAALVLNLPAGAYTAVVLDSTATVNRSGREVLVEVYNATF